MAKCCATSGKSATCPLATSGRCSGSQRRTISKYKGGMGTTLDVAIRIEEFFDPGVVESIDLVYRHEPPKAMEGEQKEGIDHDHPWNISNSWGCSCTRSMAPRSRPCSCSRSIPSSQATARPRRSLKRAALIGNLSKIAKKHAMCVITDYHKQKMIGRTLVIGQERLHGSRTALIARPARGLNFSGFR